MKLTVSLSAALSCPCPTSTATPANVGETPTAKASLEPRVSSRFSKRASILRPAALDMLKDNNTGSDGEGETSSVPAVPSVPSQYTLSLRWEQKQDEHESLCDEKKATLLGASHRFIMVSLSAALSCPCPLLTRCTLPLCWEQNQASHKSHGDEQKATLIGTSHKLSSVSLSAAFSCPCPQLTGGRQGFF